ncbi:tol-pal system protein YbgF, partial [mine drainage metagenome]
AATLAASSAAARAPITPAAQAAEQQTAYDGAFAFLRNGDYAEAARRFRAFLLQYPHASLAPNAAYWLGESYYVTGNYQVALDTFHRLLTQYPQSDKSRAALLKL